MTYTRRPMAPRLPKGLRNDHRFELTDSASSCCCITVFEMVEKQHTIHLWACAAYSIRIAVVRGCI